MKIDNVILSMGAGGTLSHALVEGIFLSSYGNSTLNELDDAAEMAISSGRLVFTTDSYTVKPIFFPGGDIGKLAICGTANDLAVKGARPIAVSAAFIIEEGFPMADLKRIANSMHEQAERIGVKIVTGDTKVVSRNEADGVFINTSGIGKVMGGLHISCRSVKPGDDIIISGSIGDHGIAILNARHSLGFEPAIKSDVAALVDIVEKIAPFGKHIHTMRDPTRGGLAGVLNEIANASEVSVRIFEKDIPLKSEVSACCDLLGIDPLYVANEGKAVIFVNPQATREVLAVIKSVASGADASVIGKVLNEPFSRNIPAVSIETKLGTNRFVPMLDGDILPRIC